MTDPALMPHRLDMVLTWMQTMIDRADSFSETDRQRMVARCQTVVALIKERVRVAAYHEPECWAYKIQHDRQDECKCKYLVGDQKVTLFEVCRAAYLRTRGR